MADYASSARREPEKGPVLQQVPLWLPDLASEPIKVQEPSPNEGSWTCASCLLRNLMKMGRWTIARSVQDFARTGHFNFALTICAKTFADIFCTPHILIRSLPMSHKEEMVAGTDELTDAGGRRDLSTCQS